MRQIHHIWITVYSKPEDAEAEVEKGLIKFLPFNLEEEKIAIERQTAEGFEERRIIILKAHLEKARHINRFIENLNGLLDEGQKRLIVKQKESRLDLENHFFLRFDKDKLIKESSFFITDSGNCYHIKMSLAPFPSKRENALKIVEEIFWHK
jgi:RNA binding exosome subunit